MVKIDFKNLPDTTTPITADNMNTLQDNVETAINESKIDIYSTTEQRVGTWIDGKPVYSKTFEVSLSNDSNITQAHNISNVSKIWIDENKTFIWGGSEGLTGNWYYSSSDWARTWVNPTSIRFRSPSSIGGRTLYITLNYTKTTD